VIDLDWGEGRVTTTSEHPFYDPVGARWVRAGELTVGSTVARWQGRELVVDRLEGTSVRQVERTVYNLTVAGEHNYLVDDVLVHNKGAPIGNSGDSQHSGDSMHTGDSQSTGDSQTNGDSRFTGDSCCPHSAVGDSSGGSGSGGSGAGGSGG
jgi:hypothetical protein